MLRLQCSLEPVDAPDWGHWTAYVVTPGTTPLPVVDFEGMELTRAVRRSGGIYLFPFPSWMKMGERPDLLSLDSLFRTVPQP